MPHDPAARARAQNLLNNLKRSNLVGASPVGRTLELYIQTSWRKARASKTEQDAINRAKQELAKHRRLVTVASKVAQMLQSAGGATACGQEVIVPARTGAMGAAELWNRVSGMMSTPANPFPFLSWVESNVGPLTISLGLKAQAGLALGIGGYEGISGLRHRCACFYRSGSVSAGAIEGADIGVQVSFGPGLPSSGLSYTVEVDMGGGMAPSAKWRLRSSRIRVTLLCTIRGYSTTPLTASP